MQKFNMAIRNFLARHFDIEKMKKNIFLQKISEYLYARTHKARVMNLQKYGYEALRLLYQVSSETGILLWADYGTLLGLVREGALIKHDYDIDTGCYALTDEHRQILISSLQKYGFILSRQFFLGDMIIEDAFLFKDLCIDIVYYFAEDENLVSYSFYASQQTTNQISGKSRTVKGMEVCRFHSKNFELNNSSFLNGTPVLIPKNCEEVVESQYGPNWKMPDSSWDWVTGMKYENLGFRDDCYGRVDV